MTGLLVGGACFAMHAMVSLLWLHVPGRTSPVARHAASALGTHVVGVLLAAWWIEPLAYWPAAAVSGFLAVCWLFAFSAVYKSVSLRILTQLACTPGHTLSLKHITNDYVRPEFESRIQVLLRMNCAEENEGGFAVTPKGRETARKIERLRQLCGIDGNGMYGNAKTTAADHNTGVCESPVS